MVSDEIADQVDKSQFAASETLIENEDSGVSDVVVIQLECDETTIPGLLQDYKKHTEGMQEKLTFQFLTDPKNVGDIHKKLANVTSIVLTIGGETVVRHRIAEMDVSSVRIQQSVANAGCVITVVYK